ncbi:MAG: cyclic nucleotide-binding domain-containing protein, partial [Waterburya sp.]
MNIPDLVSFLQQKTCFANLSVEVLNAIASLLSTQTIAADQVLISENTEPQGLYIIESGKAKS